MDVLDGTEDIDEDRAILFFLQLMIMNIEILVDESVEVVIDTVVGIGIHDVRAYARDELAEHVAFSDAGLSRFDPCRPSPRVHLDGIDVGDSEQVPGVVVVDENDLLIGHDRHRVKVRRCEFQRGVRESRGIGISVVVDPVKRIARTFQERIPDHADASHPERIHHPAAILAGVRDVVIDVIERPVIRVLAIIFNRGDANIRPHQHAEYRPVVRGCPLVRNLIEPEDIVFGKKLRPLKCTHAHLEGHAIASRVRRVRLECNTVETQRIIRPNIEMLVIIVIHDEVGLQVGAALLAEIAVPGSPPPRVGQIAELVRPERRPRGRIIAQSNRRNVRIEVAGKRLPRPILPRALVLVAQCCRPVDRTCDHRMERHEGMGRRVIPFDLSADEGTDVAQITVIGILPGAPVAEVRGLADHPPVAEHRLDLVSVHDRRTFVRIPSLGKRP